MTEPSKPVRKPAGAAVPRRYLNATQRKALSKAQGVELVGLLRKYRSERVTLQELADAVGVSRQRIHQITHGQ